MSDAAVLVAMIVIPSVAWLITRRTRTLTKTADKPSPEPAAMTETGKKEKKPNVADLLKEGKKKTDQELGGIHARHWGASQPELKTGLLARTFAGVHHEKFHNMSHIDVFEVLDVATPGSGKNCQVLVRCLRNQEQYRLPAGDLQFFETDIRPGDLVGATEDLPYNRNVVDVMMDKGDYRNFLAATILRGDLFLVTDIFYSGALDKLLAIVDNTNVPVEKLKKIQVGVPAPGSQYKLKKLTHSWPTDGKSDSVLFRPEFTITVNQIVRRVRSNPFGGSLGYDVEFNLSTNRNSWRCDLADLQVVKLESTPSESKTEPTPDPEPGDVVEVCCDTLAPATIDDYPLKAGDRLIVKDIIGGSVIYDRFNHLTGNILISDVRLVRKSVPFSVGERVLRGDEVGTITGIGSIRKYAVGIRPAIYVRIGQYIRLCLPEDLTRIPAEGDLIELTASTPGYKAGGRYLVAAVSDQYCRTTTGLALPFHQLQIVRKMKPIYVSQIIGDKRVSSVRDSDIRGHNQVTVKFTDGTVEPIETVAKWLEKMPHYEAGDIVEVIEDDSCDQLTKKGNHLLIVRQDNGCVYFRNAYSHQCAIDPRKVTLVCHKPVFQIGDKARVSPRATTRYAVPDVFEIQRLDYLYVGGKYRPFALDNRSHSVLLEDLEKVVPSEVA